MARVKGSSAAHTALLNEVLIAVGSLPLCRVWRNECGMGLNIRTGEPFHYGLQGSPDIIGFLNDGRFIGIEIKTGDAVQSEKQKNFQAVMVKFNCLYFLARSVESAVAFVRAAAKP